MPAERCAQKGGSSGVKNGASSVSTVVGQECLFRQAEVVVDARDHLAHGGVRRPTGQEVAHLGQQGKGLFVSLVSGESGVSHAAH